MTIDLYNLTAMQKKAVMHEGENILVAAGAGSGKTKVLSLRVMRKLTDGIDIDKLVILTFTRLAAEEMKARIRKSVSASKDLKPIESRIENATISTFDAFALSIVRKYHYMLNLPSKIDIADEAMLEALREKCLNETLDEFYIMKDPGFVRVVERLFDRGDDKLKEAINVASFGLETLPDYHRYLDNYENDHFSSESIGNILKEFNDYIGNRMIASTAAGSSVFYDTSNPVINEYFLRMKNFYHRIKEANTLEEKIDFLRNESFPRSLTKSSKIEDDTLDEIKSAHSRAKTIYDGIAKTVKSLQASSKETLIEDIQETKETVLTILRLADAFLLKMENAMREKEMYHYGDIMRFAIKLFEDNPELRDRLSGEINEIMVDEYQDTNDIQEYLLQLISRNNLFMVGDIKQSIYGFRNANPGIFLAKYHAYEKGSGGILIDLRENFRSRPEVLEYINDFFMPVMDEEIGGIDYFHNQSMIYAQKNYEKHSILAAGAKKLVYIPELRPDDEDKTKTEALAVACDIFGKLKNRETTLDRETMTERSLKYGDIAVIADRKTGFDIIAKTFSDMGIPVKVYTEESFIMTEEIMMVWQFMQAAFCLHNNDFSDHSLARSVVSLARSFAYRIKDDDIVCFLKCEGLENIDGFIKLKDNKAFAKLAHDIKNVASVINIIPLPEIVSMICKVTGAYESIIRLKDPEACEKRLDYLYMKALELQNIGFVGFLDYLNSVGLKEEADIAYENVAADTSDMVKVLSMHKSKGLEYPVCYYVGLDKKFNFTENKNLFVFDRKYGLSTKTWSDGFKPNIVGLLLLRRARKEYVSERIRLLYVALTRSREQQIIVLPEINKEEAEASFMDNGCLDSYTRESINKYSRLFSLLPHIPEKKEEALINIPEMAEKPVKVFTAKPVIYLNLTWEKKDLIGERFSKETAGILLKEEEKNALAYGNLLHEAMEYVDFNHPENSLENIPDNAKDRIIKLLQKEPFDKIRKMRIYREYPVYEEIDGIAKNGVIDLLALSDKEAIVVDYKSGDIDKSEYTEQIFGYANIIRKMTNKPTSAYLCSLWTGAIRKVD
ncbi:MAG TPA: UvrD-helicase domain-containing protein [Bacillota bacterium]|nr:UvrD-helicase domain-containing protein [Bacillota bacterium]